MSLYEYINTINEMLEQSKEDTCEMNLYLNELEELFLK
jgi:hypothetical protein